MKNNNTDNEQMILGEFSGSDEGNNTHECIPLPGQDWEHAFSVNLCEMKSVETRTADELFSGFDTLEAITFSYDLNFIQSVSDKFEDITVILGNERMMGQDYCDLITMSEAQAIPCIKRHKKLVQRVSDNTAHFYRTKGVDSHEKIYLLTSKDGRSRIINTSANFTRHGWSGPSVQFENVDVFENDPVALQNTQIRFEQIYHDCPPIEREKVYLTDSSYEEPIEELPVIKEALVKHAAIILDQAPDTKEEVEYVVNLQSNMNQFKEARKTIKIKFTEMDKDGVTSIKPENLSVFIPKFKEFRRIKLTSDKSPKLYINYDDNVITFNGDTINYTDIDEDGVKTDLNVLIEYFKGYDGFKGTSAEKATQTKEIFYKVLNYIFLSPFISKLRLEAFNSGNYVESFPMFAIIQGRKSAGKSQFMKTAYKFMFTGMGRFTIANLPKADFVNKKILDLIKIQQGIPFHIEDLDRERFDRNCDKVIKQDEILFFPEPGENIAYIPGNSPTFIITTNQITEIPDEIEKRSLYFSVPATQKNATTGGKQVLVNGLLNKVTGQLYLLYLQKMIPAVDNLISEMYARAQTESNISGEGWVPDIFKVSSDVLAEIFNEAGIPRPGYAVDLVRENYFTPKEKTAKAYILNLWNCYSDKFEIDRPNNRLTYNTGQPVINHGDKNLQNEFCNTVPEELEATPIGISTVALNLEQTEKLTGIKFKKRKGFFKK